MYNIIIYIYITPFFITCVTISLCPPQHHPILALISRYGKAMAGEHPELHLEEVAVNQRIPPS